MAAKFKLADAANVMAPAYLAIIQKGFLVRVKRWTSNTDNSEQELWIAEDTTREFVADGPVALLGLISVHEARGEDWQASDEQIDDFINKFCA